MSLSAELAAHDERVLAAKARARDVDLEVRAAAAKVDEARNEVIEAHADGDDAKADKLAKAVRAAEEAEKRLRLEKFVGAQRAAQRAEDNRIRFASENFAGLVVERRPQAEAVARGFEDAMSSIQARHAEWVAMEREMMYLCRLAGHQTGGIPRFPERLATFVRDVSRAGGLNVPAPFPGSAHATPLPADEPVQRSVDRGVIDLTDTKAV